MASSFRGAARAAPSLGRGNMCIDVDDEMRLQDI